MLVCAGYDHAIRYCPCPYISIGWKSFICTHPVDTPINTKKNCSQTFVSLTINTVSLTIDTATSDNKQHDNVLHKDYFFRVNNWTSVPVASDSDFMVGRFLMTNLSSDRPHFCKRTVKRC